MEIDVQVLKFIEDFALIEAAVTVDGTEVTKGKLGFARRSLEAGTAHQYYCAENAGV